MTKRPVQSGDKYKVVRKMWTRAGYFLNPGDTLEVIEPTGHDPYGEAAYLNRKHNWLVKTHYGVTVWATLESLVACEHPVLSLLP